MIEPHWWCNG